MEDDGLALDDVLADLKHIIQVVVDEAAGAQPASYDTIQSALADDLHLHLLSYIRFLEQQEYVVYDRIKDEVSVTDEGHEALDNPDTWREEVHVAFSEHIAEDFDEDEYGDVIDDVGEDLIDDIATGVEDSISEDDYDYEDDATRVVDPNSAPDWAEDEPDDAEPSEPSDPAPIDRQASKDIDDMDQPAGSTTRTSNSTTSEYERIDELGSGGVGTVHRAIHTKLARDVALKEINEVFNVFAQVQREDIITRFSQIVREQASLVHPNIVQIFDVETDVEYPFVVMQYAPRGNLRRLIEMDDRPVLTVALKYFLQILNGLGAAHQDDIVHGNLKPENVVLDSTGNAMLSDFGMSRVVESEGGRGGQVYVGVGTVAYMPPEQFENPNASSVKADIYSLGIMFYEMLTGKVPGRRSPMPSSFFPDIPRKLDDIFDKMSMDAIEDRYESTDEILEDFYAADEVMELVDNRSGVLFFKDPIETGGAAVAVPGDEEDSSVGLSESSSSDLEEESSEASDAEEQDQEDGGEADDADGDVEDEDSDEAAEDSEAEVEDDENEGEEAAEGEDDEVLDKLDEYGEMFDE